MAYLEHIGIFDSLADEYQALTYGGFKFPFVAKVNGVLDYNGQYFTDEPVVIVYDSEGSKMISGTTYASGIYNFSFQTDTDAGFELYNNYSAVTASTCLIEADADCEGTVTDTERGIDETDYEMIAVGFDWDGYHDDESPATVDINITFNTNDMSVSGIATVYYCADPCAEYEEGTQERCECEGRYWYDDECHDEADCGGDPECECNQDGYNWWEDDTCHSCWDEWEDLGYSSPEECACDKRGEDSGACPEE